MKSNCPEFLYKILEERLITDIDINKSRQTEYYSYLSGYYNALDFVVEHIKEWFNINSLVYHEDFKP